MGQTLKEINKRNLELTQQNSRSLINGYKESQTLINYKKFEQNKIEPNYNANEIWKTETRAESQQR